MRTYYVKVVRRENFKCHWYSQREFAFKMFKTYSFKKSVNETQISAFENVDYFSNVYEDPFIKFTLLLSYLLSYLNILPAGLVIWFERSGRAGQFRTLINQLASFSLDQVWNGNFDIILPKLTLWFYLVGYYWDNNDSNYRILKDFVWPTP